MQKILLGVDRVNTFIGKLFGWSIVVLTFAVSYEVFVRYVLKAPTTWAFDVSYMLYGTLFMMAGAYTLARNGHVRGDFIYRNWAPQTQAKVDLTLYILFFFPGILALIYGGWTFAYMSYLFNERSSFSPAGPVIWPFKFLIPITGVMMLAQGLSETVRCIICIRTGAWPQRLHDVEEMDQIILKQHEDDGADLNTSAGAR